MTDALAQNEEPKIEEVDLKDHDYKFYEQVLLGKYQKLLKEHPEWLDLLIEQKTLPENAQRELIEAFNNGTHVIIAYSPWDEYVFVKYDNKDVFYQTPIIRKESMNGQGPNDNAFVFFMDPRTKGEEEFSLWVIPIENYDTKVKIHRLPEEREIIYSFPKDDCCIEITENTKAFSWKDKIQSHQVKINERLTSVLGHEICTPNNVINDEKSPKDLKKIIEGKDSISYIEHLITEKLHIWIIVDLASQERQPAVFYEERG